MEDRNHTKIEDQKDPLAGHLVALAILCGLMFFFGIGRLPLIGPDEPRYAEVAREMFLSGDWITPRLGGINWFEKPALTYWLSAAGYKLFGVSEFSARFGIALTAAAGVFLLYFFGRRIRSARFGYLAASVLVTCGLWPAFARGATFDLPVSVAMLLALLSFFVWEGDSEAAANGRNRFWWLFCFALGLAVLAKGLIGIVLPCAIVVAWLLITRRLKIILSPFLLAVGTMIFLATAAIWYGPIIARHGRVFIDEFFIAHHFQRYLSNKYRHPQPVYFFILVVLAGSFPWLIYLCSGAWQTIKDWRERFDPVSDKWRIFLWLWVLIPVIFFSFSGSKLPGYILPVFPAVAMLVALELEKWWDAAGTPKYLDWVAVTSAAVIFVVAIVVALGGERYFGMNLMQSFTIAAIAIVTVVIYLFVWFLISGGAATSILPFGIALILMASISILSPVLSERESLRDLSLKARELAQPGERLVFYINQDNGINFYATDLPLRDERSELLTPMRPEKILMLMKDNKAESFLVLSRREWSESLTYGGFLNVEQLGQQRQSVKCSPVCDWLLYRVRENLK